MSTPVEVHGFKVYGSGVNHGIDYLKNLRPKEAKEMFDNARNSRDKDHHFEAHIAGSGNVHYVLIHRSDGTYDLKYKP